MQEPLDIERPELQQALRPAAATDTAAARVEVARIGTGVVVQPVTAEPMVVLAQLLAPAAGRPDQQVEQRSTGAW